MQYNALYAGPDEEIYKTYYYGWENGRALPIDLEYLKRCIRSHGLDLEEVLADYVWDPVRGLRRRSDVLREQEAERRREQEAERKSEAEIRWQEMLKQLPSPVQKLEELDTEQRHAVMIDRVVQLCELGWSTLPEPVLALKREAQALMKEAGVSDWTQVCICQAFVPGGRDALTTPKGSWADPPAERIKKFAGDILPEELQEKLFGLLMRMKREWESAPGKEI